MKFAARVSKHFIIIPALLALAINIEIVLSQYAIDDHSQSPLDPKGDDTYLRLVFNNGSEQYFRNWECPDGVWADDMFQDDPPKCACVKGVFAISKGLCDEEFEILTGNEHCYDISKTLVRKFTPLTGQKGLAGRANTVFRSDAPYFARLISPTPTLFVNEPVHYLFRLNDPNDFSTYASLPDGSAARLGCFEAQPVTGNGSANPVMNIAKLPDCSDYFRGPQDWCSDKDYDKYLATIKLGTKWGPKGSGSGNLYPGGCAPKISNSGRGSSGRGIRGRGRGRRSAIRKSSSSNAVTQPPPRCDEFPQSAIELPQQRSQYVDYFVDRVENLPHSFHTSSTHQMEVNDQTVKITKSLMDFHLGSPLLKSRMQLVQSDKLPAYRFIQISRQIMEKLCPEELVPKYVLAMMVRIFRIIFLDVSDKYPYPEKMFENSTMNREIINTLTKCRDSAKPMSFMKNQTCPDAGVYGTNYSNVQYMAGMNLTIPPPVQFNLSSMDLPLETVWKMMLLTHYYCADNFTNGAYHSEFVVKYEAFLRNPAVLYRWYHPGPANAVFKLILSAYNLKQFAKSIDRCVATANSLSSYKGWLHRPADTLKWKSLYNGTVAAGLNSTNATAPNPIKGIHGRTVKSRKTIKTGKAVKRVKRYYFQNNLWADKAYCLRNSKAIVTEVQSSQESSCKVVPAWFQNTD